MCMLHGDLFICMSVCLLTLPSIVCLPISYHDVTITVVHKRPIFLDVTIWLLHIFH